MNIIKRIKPWMLPIAMVIGVAFHQWIGYVAFMSTYLIFLMLTITYCKVSIRHFRLDGSMLWLLAIQIVGAFAVYAALLSLSQPVAESIFICILCPTATAAPVITGMLGGRVERVATYSLLSNVTVAILAPFALAMMGENATQISFKESVMTIAMKVVPVLLGPLAVATALKLTVRRLSDTIATHQGLSFYIWAFALVIVVGNSVSFMLREPASCVPDLLKIIPLSLAACLLQFYLGRRIGGCYGDPVAGAQSLGQKNTVLAIWLALTYLNPIASIGPALYIVWHNSVNSWQIYRQAHRGKL